MFMSIFGSIKNFIFGQKGKHEQQPIYDPQRMKALDQLLKSGMANTDIGALQGEARKGFETDILPTIAERFTGLGGGVRSSAFQGALGQAGSDLSSRLAGLRYQGGMQQLGLGLRPTTQNVYYPGQQGAMEQLMPLLLQLGGSYLGGPAGAMLGGALGKTFQGQQQQQQVQQRYMPGQPQGYNPSGMPRAIDPLSQLYGQY